MSLIRIEIESRCAFRFTSMIALIVAISLTAHESRADETSDAQAALKQTQDLLRNASTRQQAIKGNPAAEQADAKVRNLAGPETQAIYDLSADVMAKLVKDAAGDPAKMQELLNKAMENPSAFASQLSPDQQSKLQSIAGKIESRQGAVPKPR